MINRLSNPINRNRSAAKISKVMSSNPHPLIMGQCHFHQRCKCSSSFWGLMGYDPSIHPSIQPIRSYNLHNQVPLNRFGQVSKYFTDPSGHLTIHPYEKYISHTSLLWGDDLMTLFRSTTARGPDGVSQAEYLASLFPSSTVSSLLY